VVAYTIPGTQVSLPLVVGFVEEPVYVRFSGVEGGEPIGTLAWRRGVFGLMQPPTPPIRGLYTEGTAQKAQEAQ
jgi:hypothetical protein